MVARVSLITLISLVPSLVLADGGKFTHDGNVTVGVKRTDRSKSPPKSVEPARPEITPVDGLQIAALVGTVQKDMIVVLKKLVEDTPDTEVAEKADYLFRLGEIYAKLHRLHKLQSTRADLQNNPKLRDSEAALAKQYLLDAAGTYTKLTSNPIFATWPKTGDAVFFLAFTLHGGGYAKESRAAYDKLLKDYPHNQYVAEAHLAFADWFYESNQLADAEARYKKVLQFPKSSAYWYATYKLGWVAFNLRKHEDALETFYKVVDGTRGDPAKAILHRAARKDFVRSYAEIGRADKALAAFRRIDKAKPFELLEILGDTYLGQGKHAHAVSVYRELLVQQPTSPNVCVWQHNIARASMTLGGMADRVAEIEHLGKLYAGVGAKLPKAEAEECRDATAEMTGQLARELHNEAAKTKQPETFAFADRLYRAYLAAFPKAADAPETRYFRAELLWTRAELEKTARLATQQWEDAAEAFTVALDAGGLDVKRIPIAADAAMLARLKALHVDPTRREPPVTEATYAKVPTPKPLPAPEQKLVAALDVYLKYVTDARNDERTDVLFTKAALLRRYDHLRASTVIFEDIVAKSPKFEGAETAAQLALDNLNRLQDYPAMIALADKLAGNAAFMTDKPELAKTVATLRRQSLRKQAEAMEKTGQFVACAETFVAIYNMDVLANDADELLYNAGVCFERGHSMSGAAAVYRELQKLFPKSKLTAKSLVRLGNVYAQTAFYREAAAQLEEYAQKYAGEDDAYQALSDAVLYRKGTGDDARAIEDTMTFVRLFGVKRRAEAAAAFWSIGAILEKQGELEKVGAHYKAYVAKFGDVDAGRAVMAWTKAGVALYQRACPVKLVDGSCVKIVRETALTSLRAARETGVPKQCGDATKLRMTVVARDDRYVRDAMAAFDKAIALYDATKPSSGDVAGARYHAALAKVGKVDRDFETYLAMPLPTGLDFDRRKPAVAARSKARFEGWFKGKFELGVALRKKYEAVIEMKDGATSITSSARLGQITQGFAGQLFRAEIPADVRSGPYAEDAANEYCDALTTLAEPLEADALRSYQGCLNTSTRLGWFSEYSRLCERELGQIEPEKFPAIAELRRPADQVSAISDVEGAPEL